MARGVDMWAAEIVLEERKNNSDIKLICASPFEGFEKSWSPDEKQRYNDILLRNRIIPWTITSVIVFFLCSKSIFFHQKIENI